MDKKIEFYMTCGISADMDNDNAFACEIGMYINRFVKDDWGDLCEDDKELNRAAKKFFDGTFDTSGSDAYTGRLK